MKVNCVLCRSNKDEDVMLLCDNCNKGHHIYCLKPKLKVCLLNLLFIYIMYDIFIIFTENSPR